MALFHLLVLLAVLSSVTASAKEEDQNHVTLTREKLDQLLLVMSPACRTEMEGALGGQGQISMDCREEIQEALLSLGVELEQGPGGEPESMSEPPPRQRRPSQPSGTEPFSKISSTTTIGAIVGFVVLSFAGAAAYVLYVNTHIDPNAAAKKPKKISKKKVNRHPKSKLANHLAYVYAAP